MDKLKLFEFIQGNSKAKVLEQLKLKIDDGKTLEWFQDIIPGLIPGVDDSQPWLGHARDLIWGPIQHEEHKRKIDRKRKLLQPSPKPLPEDRYRLRRHWPVYVEALRPMTNNLLAAANEVYKVVAGQDCLTEERNVPRVTSETDNRHNAFVTIAVVLQDKVLSPVINDIEQRQTNLSKEVENTKEQMFDLEEQLRDIGFDRDSRAAHEIECQAAKQRQDDVIEEQQQDEALRTALVRFRDVLVDEKETCDQYRNLKRNKDLELPGSGEVTFRKKAKF